MSSEGSGLQAALSHVLTNSELRVVLRENPDEIRRRFRLRTEEVSALESVDAGRLDLTAHAGEAKRVDFLRRGLPLTLDVIEHAGDATVLREHLGGGWSITGPVLTSRVLGEARLLVSLLSRTLPAGLPTWIQDLAAYELASVELRASPEAGADARRAETALPPGAQLVLGRHVRLLELAYDVTAAADASTTQAPPRKPTFLALAKAAASPRVDVFRVGRSVLAILRAFTDPRDPAEVVATTVQGDSELGSKTVEQAFAAGLLLESV